MLNTNIKSKHMKALLFSMILPGIFFSSYSQDTLQTDTTRYWKHGGLISLNIAQTSFSNSWQAGGEKSFAALGLLNTNASYVKNKSSWESALSIKYGLTKLGNAQSRKTDDDFEISSKYGYEAYKKWYYSASLSFKTQMDKGYSEARSDSVISRFLAPAYLLITLGMDFKPNEFFSLAISPVTGKITIVNNDQFSQEGRFGVEPGKKVRYEFGASLISTLKKDIVKNVSLDTKLGLFYNYLDKPQLDVNWDILLNMKINKLLSANIIFQLLYDKDQIDKVQLKELLGVGLTFKF